MQPYTFSDGTYIPAGTMLALPVYTIGRDPELFPNPDVFNPYRFVNKRHDGENDHLQFTSVTNGTMAFGSGKHACPGRFFAALEIKLLMIELLKRFDFRAVPGEDGTVRRYKNIEYDSMVRISALHSLGPLEGALADYTPNSSSSRTCLM
jgi:cytochrome P450